MLAPISGRRSDGGSSFRALKNYLGFRKNKETGGLDRRSELLISESLLSEQTAQAEMRAVASENLRVKDPVYHYQLCWQENEFPQKEQWKAAAGKSIRALGFEEHQYIIAPHKRYGSLSCACHGEPRAPRTPTEPTIPSSVNGPSIRPSGR